MAAQRPIKFLELPYSDRQLIAVTEDEVVEASLKEEQKRAKKDDEGISWQTVASSSAAAIAARIALKTVTGMVGGPVVGVAALAASAASEAYVAWTKARELGLPVLQIGRTVAKDIVFPPGHWRNGVVYVGHPAQPSIYYVMSDFHRRVFEHKVCEAVDLLMSLGAVEISVEHVSGWSKDFTAEIAIPLGPSSDAAKAKARTNSGMRSQMLYQASLLPSSPPKIPPNMVWYLHEPTWRSIANGRLNHGLRDFSINVSYQDDFGINAGLSASIKKTKLDIGGNFVEQKSTVWNIQGRFSEAVAPSDLTPKRRRPEPEAAADGAGNPRASGRARR